MRLKHFIYIILLLTIGSCKKEPSDTLSNKKIFDLYNGTYFIESAVSESPVDINQDGVSSNNTLSEIEELKFSHVNLVIRSSTMALGMGWPEQNSIPTDHETESPVYTYNYQSRSYTIDFNNDLDEINIIRPNESQHLAPYDIKIDGDLLTLKITRIIYVGLDKKEIVVTACFRKDPDLIETYF